MNASIVPADRRYAEIWYEWRQDPVARQYNPFAPSTVEALREFLTTVSSDITQFEQVDRFIWFLESNHEIVGNLNLYNVNKTMLTAEIGYLISPDARRNGFATFGVRTLTQMCFQKTPLRKLIAYVHEDNLPSRRILEKLGYRAEGLLREHYLIDGKPANEVVYGILAREWIQMNELAT